MAIITALSLAMLTLGNGLVASASTLRHQSAAQKLSLKTNGYLTVGTDATYPPMESNSNGKIVGADVDLANALARAMGLKGAIMVNHVFDTIIPAMLVRHQFDAIMSSMNDTPARRGEGVAFVDYMRASEAILVRSSSSIHTNSYAGLCGHSVAVERGTTEQDGLDAANKKCKKSIDIHVLGADTDAYQAFNSGHVDAYTGDLPVAANYVALSHGRYRLAGKAFAAGEDYGIGLPKAEHALKVALKNALRKIKQSGKYRHILQKWHVSGAAL
jgi:polar amino acid transport system substrate-binding protein